MIRYQLFWIPGEDDPQVFLIYSVDLTEEEREKLERCHYNFIGDDFEEEEWLSEFVDSIKFTKQPQNQGKPISIPNGGIETRIIVSGWLE